MQQSKNSFDEFTKWLLSWFENWTGTHICWYKEIFANLGEIGACKDIPLYNLPISFVVIDLIILVIFLYLFATALKDLTSWFSGLPIVKDAKITAKKIANSVD